MKRSKICIVIFAIWILENVRWGGEEKKKERTSTRVIISEHEMLIFTKYLQIYPQQLVIICNNFHSGGSGGGKYKQTTNSDERIHNLHVFARPEKKLHLESYLSTKSNTLRNLNGIFSNHTLFDWLSDQRWRDPSGIPPKCNITSTSLVVIARPARKYPAFAHMRVIKTTKTYRNSHAKN